MATLAATRQSALDSDLENGSGAGCHTKGTIDFRSKLKFDSSKLSTVRRSDLYSAPSKQYVYDIWTLQPPNFNPQAFEPRPVERNSREAVRPWEYDRFTAYKTRVVANAAKRKSSDKRLSDYIKQLRDLSNSRAKTCGALETRSDFKVRYKIMDPYEARIDFVKNGMHPAGEYVMPQPHDYRQVRRLEQQFVSQARYRSKAVLGLQPG